MALVINRLHTSIFRYYQHENLFIRFIHIIAINVPAFQKLIVAVHKNSVTVTNEEVKGPLPLHP